MKWFILVSLVYLHTSSATLDLHKVATKLHTLKENVATIKKTLTDAASSGIKHLAENIDPEKVKKLEHFDLLHIIPKVQKKVELGKKLIEHKQKKLSKLIPAHPKEVVYFEPAYGIPHKTYGPPKTSHGLLKPLHIAPHKSHGPPHLLYEKQHLSYGPPHSSYGFPHKGNLRLVGHSLHGVDPGILMSAFGHHHH